MGKRIEDLEDGTRRCGVCKEIKPRDLEHFGPTGSTKSGLYGTCRVCFRKHHKKFRALHRDRLVAERAERRDALDRVRRAIGCVDCGTRSGRLDFDHRPGEVKLFDLAHADTRSWARVMAEVAKCDVRCVSCHARRHGVERGGLNW